MKKIPLTQGKFALVDDEDFIKFSNYKWRITTSGYAVRRLPGRHGVNKASYMHREILGSIKGEVVDHCNGDRTDNRKSNLRFATQSQNCQNKKSFRRFKGVYAVQGRKGYNSSIFINKKSKYLGYFYNEKDAALAYNAAAIKYFGEFAKLNNLNL